MTANDADSISVTYKVNESQLPDFRLGLKHQTYENYRMVLDRAWDRFFLRARTDMAVYISLIAAGIYAFGLPLIPGVADNMGLWVLAPAPVVAAAVWLLLWYAARKSTDEFTNAFLVWNQRFAQMHGGEETITIGPEGVSQRTGTDNLAVSWHRYHLALLQSDHLVLVFHGTVIVIPRDVLPEPPEQIAQRMARWAEDFVAKEARASSVPEIES